MTQRTQRLRGSIPIFHPDSEPLTPEESHLPQLRLENGKMHKQSYIRLKHSYPIHHSHLRSYKPWQKLPAHKLRIDKESYGILVQKFRRKKEEFVETREIKQTALRRLQLLAAAERSVLVPEINE